MDKKDPEIKIDFKERESEWPASLKSIRSDININLVDGYLTGAQILVRAVQNNKFLSDELAFPIMYLYRHHLELKLKLIWTFLLEVKKVGKSYPKTHNLLRLWNDLYDLIMPTIPLTAQENNTVRLCLEEFEKFDPNAESFRFSQRRDGVEIGQILSELDILLVSKQIDQCADILEGILLGIDHKIHYGEI